MLCNRYYNYITIITQYKQTSRLIIQNIMTTQIEHLFKNSLNTYKMFSGYTIIIIITSSKKKNFDPI